MDCLCDIHPSSLSIYHFAGYLCNTLERQRRSQSDMWQQIVRRTLTKKCMCTVCAVLAGLQLLGKAALVPTFEIQCKEGAILYSSPSQNNARLTEMSPNRYWTEVLMQNNGAETLKPNENGFCEDVFVRIWESKKMRYIMACQHLAVVCSLVKSLWPLFLLCALRPVTHSLAANFGN